MQELKSRLILMETGKIMLKSNKRRKIDKFEHIGLEAYIYTKRAFESIQTMQSTQRNPDV